MKPLRFVSWFTGVGMFDRALILAGLQRVGACEIDPFARRVYEARLGRPDFFPEDVTKVRPEDVPEADVWVGGSPCQDFSVAGMRAGIEGERSGLVLTWLALAKACRPRWIIIENVPGLLSGKNEEDERDAEERVEVPFVCGICGAHYSGTALTPCPGCGVCFADDGRASGRLAEGAAREPSAGSVSWFGILLGAMADAGFRDVAWRVLDGQHFGVAQRRRRVFVVGHLGDGLDPRSVLFEPEGVRGNSPTRGKARARAARLAALGAREGGGDVANAVARSAGHHGRSSPRGDGSDNLIVGTLTPGAHPGGYNGQDAYTGHLIGTLDSDRGTPRGNGADPIVAVVSALQTKGAGGTRIDAESAAGGHLVPVLAFSSKDYGADVGPLSPTLRSGMHDGSHANGGVPPAVVFPIDMRNVSRSTGTGVGTPGTGIGAAGDPAPSLAREGATPAVAYVVNSANSEAKASHARAAETARALDTKGGFADGQGGTVVHDLDPNGVNRSNGQTMFADKIAAAVKRGRHHGAAESEGGGETWDDEGPAPTLNVNDTHGERASALAFYSHTGLDQVIQNDISPPVTVGSFVPTPPAGLPAAAAGTYWDGGQLADCIDASVASRRQTMPERRRDAAALGPGGVRRLTPVECERLQGLPDGWTCLCGAGSTSACTCPDGPRYRAIGNGGVVPNMQWIAERLVRAEEVAEVTT